MCNGCLNLSFEIIWKLTQRWVMGKHHTYWGFWFLAPPFTEFLTGLKSIFHLQYLSESGKPQWYQSMVSHKERLTFLWSLCEKSMVWFNFSKARKRRELGFLFKNNTRFSFIKLKWSFSFLELNWMFSCMWSLCYLHLGCRLWAWKKSKQEWILSQNLWNWRVQNTLAHI